MRSQPDMNREQPIQYSSSTVQYMVQHIALSAVHTIGQQSVTSVTSDCERVVG